MACSLEGRQPYPPANKLNCERSSGLGKGARSNSRRSMGLAGQRSIALPEQSRVRMAASSSLSGCFREIRLTGVDPEPTADSFRKTATRASFSLDHRSVHQGAEFVT